jgi:hypothetical protein
MNYKAAQDAFTTMERLAALCATPGIEDETKKMANERIQELLSSVMKSSVMEINASSLGIVTMND